MHFYFRDSLKTRDFINDIRFDFNDFNDNDFINNISINVVL